MIFTRVYTLFFFLVSFGSLIASAKPIETTELVARTTGTYPAPTCSELLGHRKSRGRDGMY